MRPFVYTLLALQLIAFVARMGYLGWKHYPRTVTYTRGEDAVICLIELAIMAWGFYVLLLS